MKRQLLKYRIVRVETAHRALRDCAICYAADRSEWNERHLLEAAREYSAALRSLAKEAQ